MSNEKIKLTQIEFDGLTYQHGNSHSVLENADFIFPPNEVLWIHSSEGKGKSTLLMLLAGLLMPTRGSYLIDGANVSEMTFEEFLPYRLEIGYTFDYGGLLSNRSLRDNLLLPLTYHHRVSRAEASARVEKFLSDFDLKRYALEHPAHVPGRVRKLVVVLRGLIIYPQMLLMDDPTVGLGMDAIQALRAWILELRQQGYLQHIVATSQDNDFMNSLNAIPIDLEGGQIFLREQGNRSEAA